MDNQHPGINGGFFPQEELARFGFRHLGQNVQLSRAAIILSPENIILRDFCRVDAFSILSAGSTGCIDLGRYVHVGNSCFVAGASGVTLEDFAGLSPGVRLFSESDDFSGQAMAHPTIPARYRSVTKAPILLRQHSLVGSGSVVLPGAELGEGAAVGALSLVSTSLPAWGIYAGCPARKIRNRKTNPLALQAEFERDTALNTNTSNP